MSVGYDHAWDLLRDLKCPVEECLYLDDDACIDCSFLGTIELFDGCMCCSNCGTFAQQIIDMTPEWRTFVSKDGNDSSSSDKKGIRCASADDKAGSYSLQGGGRLGFIVNKYHSWTQNSNHKDRALKTILDSMTVCCNKHDIPTGILMDAKSIFSRIHGRKVVRGTLRNGVIGACVYVSCKNNGATRGMKEIADMFDLPSASIVNKGLKIVVQFGQVPMIASSTCSDFAARFAAKLNLGHTFQKQCKELASSIEDMGLSLEHSPATVAAAIVYMSGSNQGITIDDDSLSSISGISSATSKKCWKTLIPFFHAK
jgi:transcription initiation factor TFIIB